MWGSFSPLLVMTIVFLISWGLLEMTMNKNALSYKEFLNVLNNNQIESVVIEQNKAVPTGKLELVLENEEVKYLEVSDVNEVQELLKEAEVTDITLLAVQEPSWLVTVLPTILMTGALVFVVFMMTRQGGANAKAMNFGRNRAKLNNPSDKKITFANVAGLSEEKEELEEIVDFLKSPKKYIQVGARIPKGVLLVGPPGTGKTLLAKAVAGEAGVPFFTISGSDFVEMFVGVGASRVRDLFEDAKKNAPCIIFIDEIDAVARRRGTGLGGGHDEREQTLNQLLVEMDGFGVNEGIIVMAATNRVDILDPAILRPGRFDRKFLLEDQM